MAPTGERVGILGGTFDPPHIGHLVAAINVRHALDLDRVLLVVANEPWQKVGMREVTAPEDRLALVESAVEGLSGIEASAMEIERGGPSFTVDTLEALAELDPLGRRFLILGADAAGGLQTWERYESLPGLATLVLVDRPGVPSMGPPEGWVLERVTIPRLDVTSTDLRHRSTTGEPLDFLVPPGVLDRLRRHPIYGGSP